MSGSSRKRPRGTPDFCDAAKAVSATGFASSRLPELKALFRPVLSAHTDTSSLDCLPPLSGGRKTSSRHLRRRTNSHRKRRRSCRRKPSHLNSQQSPNRQVRRLDRLNLQNSHEAYRAEPKENNGDDTTSINWIPTHLWHAKRFRMEKLWGWKVPMIHSNRGCAAAKRLIREHYTLVQDATWCMQPIVIQYQDKDCIRKKLSRVIQDFSVEVCPSSGEGVLYDLDFFPKGAIGPAQWFVLPEPLVGTTTNTEKMYVYLFVHPSIRAVTLDILRKVLRDGDNQHKVIDGVPGGLACLRLRGDHALESLQESIKKLPETMFDIPLDGLASSCDCLLQKSTSSESAVSLIRRVLPRNPSKPENCGVCGWDIFCQVESAKILFQALVLVGKACPIGITEEASLCLECSPPMSLFPRDFPDSLDGESYWTNQSDDWILLRKHWEGGDGRIRIWHLDPPSIDFQQFVPDTPVVVRGSFGNTFREVLSSAALLPNIASRSPKRRKRRPSNNAVHVEAPVLPPELADAHRQRCDSLIKSLSLPAILQCYLQITAKGKLKPGSRILDVKLNHIGFVASGAFSHSRGRCHGLGFIGASKFLSIAMHREDTVVTKYNGCKELQLRALVTNCSQTYEVTVSLPSMQ